MKLYEISITANQNNLYRELLDYGNDRSDLDDYFHLKNDALLSITGMSKSTFVDSRRSLVQMDLIEYKKGRKDKDTPQYKIVKLYQDFKSTKKGDNFVPTNNTGTKNDDKSVPTSVPEPVPTPVPETVPKELTSTRHKQTNTKHHHNDDDEFKNLLTLYQQNIGATSPIVIENLRYAVDDFKQHDNSEKQATEIVQEAIKIATFNNVHSWKYINTTLMNWQNDSLFTLANIRADQKRRTSKRSGGRRVEVATDWDKVKAKKMSNNSNELQERLAKIRGKQDATN
ncbi:hypothetical protein FD03_GL002590 [Companilactobacillus nodensis DSM 19682 = JCM 14932 = NBRC 107160]|uniref:DnaB/C C-terminal domain-containing protein n=2 Tax=Companilactobacillus nodensis TaxID=460870 RepID=A0A0R1KJV7_9LACO|nr:hypothetical protein FD03_GL002590 [Companilactobacillus nodensis DSM 19682 = JCM 14932 = NBRC 107160]